MLRWRIKFDYSVEQHLLLFFADDDICIIIINKHISIDCDWQANIDSSLLFIIIVRIYVEFIFPC